MTHDLTTLDAPSFGRMLKGVGLNLLVSEIAPMTAFLEAILECHIVRQDSAFAIVRYGDQLIQLHQDGTYSQNPFLSLVPEAGVRGGGAEIRFFETDPDQAAKRAEAAGGHILQAPTNKPHGLRETYILGPDGYCFVPSRPLQPKPGEADYASD